MVKQRTAEREAKAEPLPHHRTLAAWVSMPESTELLERASTQGRVMGLCEWCGTTAKPPPHQRTLAAWVTLYRTIVEIRSDPHLNIQYRTHMHHVQSLAHVHLVRSRAAERVRVLARDPRQLLQMRRRLVGGERGRARHALVVAVPRRVHQVKGYDLLALSVWKLDKPSRGV